jgi:polysaccharide export outer membrane protein
MRLRPFLLVLATATLAGCVMPRSVSSLGEVEEASEAGRITLVPVTAATLPAAAEATAGFPAEFTAAGTAEYEAIGPGDVLKVTIWEGGAPTVFTTGSGDLGEIAVDEAGRIYVPFAGTVPVAGRTIPQAREAITARLRSVIRNPQVDLRAARPRSKLVSVQGNAGKAGTYPIERGRTRLGELLGEVAPELENPEMLDVTVRRNGQVGSVRMADVLRDPPLDIALQPGDSIILNEVVQHVTVLGAAGTQGQVRIAKRAYNVTDVLGQARGLDENAADPRAIFLIRAEPGQASPVVYQFEMRRPETVALASRFIVRDGDVVMISNAPFTQTRKALSALTQTLGTARSAITVVP